MGRSESSRLEANLSLGSGAYLWCLCEMVAALEAGV